MFWDVALCTDSGTCCHHCWDRKFTSALTLKAAGSSETSARVYQVAQHHSCNRGIFSVVTVLCEIWGCSQLRCCVCNMDVIQCHLVCRSQHCKGLSVIQPSLPTSHQVHGPTHCLSPPPPSLISITYIIYPISPCGCSSWSTLSWRRKHSAPLDLQELLTTDTHIVVSQKTWIFMTVFVWRCRAVFVACSLYRFITVYSWISVFLYYVQWSSLIKIGDHREQVESLTSYTDFYIIL